MDYDKLIERLQKEAYGSDIEDLLLGASTAIETLQSDLARVTAERNAAQALLAERIGVRGAEPITTAFGLPLDRLSELAQADREGRCVVLPCKVGDTLYDIYEAMGNGTGEIRELKVNDIRIHLDKRSKEWLIAGGYYFSLSDFGKTVFLTREDAEAALRREQDGNNK